MFRFGLSCWHRSAASRHFAGLGCEKCSQPPFVEQRFLMCRLPQRSYFFFLAPRRESAALKSKVDQRFEMGGLWIVAAHFPADNRLTRDTQNIRQSGLGQLKRGA